ncbi:hypothetical protein J4E90_006319 [Alternaria incomplexa]|uniref:uncharacterized protein n=1 Tax=Alternaria incomplexa TaxID=1187928 RepID=UPI00221FB526|nr:uncharacterized protein J4E90_006319 [Alternaria incomplexa]KAI4912911.1 hypothetical protein J4E90_006319 [Alternaria incomplexa]
MASIYDKLAQAKYEEKLKATILALAKSVYGQNEPADVTFDVTTGFEFDSDSDEKTDMVAWVIYYPQTDDEKLDWEALLQSKRCSSIEDTYQSLIQALRVKMADLMG